MIHFKTINTSTFLQSYWQKKPLVIRQALPNFISPLSPNELAGLALEEDVDSRLIMENSLTTPPWQLRCGPFIESDFLTLPPSHWTLLVNGVDRLVPEVGLLLDHFNFIPSWRVDDVMVSYAVQHGSVGPHYDNYDVFLYQAMGRRKWSLTTKNCHLDNYLPDLDLRIMATFDVEEEYILEEGDLLYLPAHVGHHGVSISDECMTYSFGYRSYSGHTLWESWSDFLLSNDIPTSYYVDPDWTSQKAPAEISQAACSQARQLMQEMLNDESLLQSWFASFATSLNEASEQHLPIPDESPRSMKTFLNTMKKKSHLQWDATCRLGYLEKTSQLFINGTEWNTTGIARAFIQYVANHRVLTQATLQSFLHEPAHQKFLYDMWTLRWIF